MDLVMLLQSSLVFCQESIAAMTKINANAVQLVKKTAKEKMGTDVTDDEAERAIADYFDPTIPPPDISQDQIDEIVESMWADNSF